MLSRCRLFRDCFWKAVSEKPRYDVCVIGGGPAGVAAAMRAVDYKKKVCLIEKNKIGGSDLWNGTLQSKTMWEFSNYMRKLKGAQGLRLYGEDVPSRLEVDEEAMHQSLHHVSSTREGQIKAALEACPNVDFLTGQATFNSDHEVLLYNRESKEYKHISADYFVIATGSRPRDHPYVPTDGELVVTSDHIMHLPLPEKLVVVGAGVVGCEFACILAGLGKTKVSMIDRHSHIFNGEDPDIIKKVESQMEQSGVTIHHNSTLYDIQPWREGEPTPGSKVGGGKKQSGVQYTIMHNDTRQLETFQVDRALISIGRVRNYEGLGLENTTLRTQDGVLQVNDVGLCHGTKHIYAVGDCCASVFLVSMGEQQGRTAVDDMYGMEPPSPSKVKSSMSSSAYVTQNVSAVGLNETQCRARNISYIAARVGYDLVSRAVAEGGVEGFIKIIVADDSRKTILGVRAVGLNSSTLVDLGSLAIYNGQSVFDLANRLTAYPAVSQAFQECLRVILGRSELKPNCFDSLTLTRWSPDHYARGEAYQNEERVRKDDEKITPPAEDDAAQSFVRVCDDQSGKFTATTEQAAKTTVDAPVEEKNAPETQEHVSARYEEIKEKGEGAQSNNSPQDAHGTAEEESNSRLGGESEDKRTLRAYPSGSGVLPGTYFKQ
ncbi:dihydrolipoamide dehydrogenase [Angomonas deanei]|nr:dihydrolipoamide dehydrogenase [Angomonas deanei]|eukprot:EPY38302.1 dihydrolipoamide dehydrogenase [Angomonas deanei]